VPLEIYAVFQGAYCYAYMVKYVANARETWLSHTHTHTHTCAKLHPYEGTIHFAPHLLVFIVASLCGTFFFA